LGSSPSLPARPANAAGYETGIDRKVFKEGKIAAHVRMKNSMPGQFGTLGRQFLARPYRGKRVRLSVQIKMPGRKRLVDQPLPFRLVGALAMTQQFFPVRVTQQYDALIYFDRTRPSVCFRVKSD
jgi:hypothetical protein